MASYTHNGKPLNLGPPIGRGGEAVVCEVLGNPDIVAKIYHKNKRLDDQVAKLTLMVKSPPRDTAMIYHGHTSIAWPKSVLYEDEEELAGFIMPKVRNVESILAFYNPTIREGRHKYFDWRYLHRAASNLARVITAIHAQDYVVGDLNESNILVSNDALVSIIDTDSFQVRDSLAGKVYRCTVGKPEFTPPELQGADFRTTDREPYHDNFGLAVLVFQLLMQGIHPFVGISNNSSTSKTEPIHLTNMEVGIFPFMDNSLYEKPLYAPDFHILHPELQSLFTRCFVDGYEDPKLRPIASEWEVALISAERMLVPCRENSQHYYSNHLESCPWCALEKKLRVGDLPIQIPLRTPIGWTSIEPTFYEDPLAAQNMPSVGVTQLASAIDADRENKHLDKQAEHKFRVDVLHSTNLYRHRAFEFGVVLRRLPNLTEDARYQRNDFTLPNKAATSFVVDVSSPDCLIVDQPFQVVRFGAKDNPPILWFTLLPLKSGKIWVRVTIIHEITTLTALRIPLVIVEPDVDPWQEDFLAVVENEIVQRAAHMQTLRVIRSALMDSFSYQELDSLCFDMGIDFESLEGDTKDAKAQHLTMYCYRHNRLPSLIGWIKIRRPGSLLL